MGAFEGVSPLSQQSVQELNPTQAMYDQRLGSIAGARSAHADTLGAPNGEDRQPRLLRDESRDPLFIVPYPPRGA